MARAVGILACCWRPALRLPTIGWILHKQSSYHRDDQMCDPEIGECAQDTNALNQPRRHRRGNKRAGAEAADRDSGNKPSAVWEPLHQDCHRNDVAKTKAKSSYHPVTEI